MKGSTGTSMGSVVRFKVKKTNEKHDCRKCIEYLKTNLLCKLGRDTSNPRRCKWYYAGKNSSKKQLPPKQKSKTMLEVIDSINKTIEERKIKQQKKHDEKFNKK